MNKNTLIKMDAREDITELFMEERLHGMITDDDMQKLSEDIAKIRADQIMGRDDVTEQTFTQTKMDVMDTIMGTDSRKRKGNSDTPELSIDTNAYLQPADQPKRGTSLIRIDSTTTRGSKLRRTETELVDRIKKDREKNFTHKIPEIEEDDHNKKLKLLKKLANLKKIFPNANIQDMNTYKSVAEIEKYIDQIIIEHSDDEIEMNLETILTSGFTLIEKAMTYLGFDMAGYACYQNSCMCTYRKLLLDLSDGHYLPKMYKSMRTEFKIILLLSLNTVGFLFGKSVKQVAAISNITPVASAYSSMQYEPVTIDNKFTTLSVEKVGDAPRETLFAGSEATSRFAESHGDVSHRPASPGRTSFAAPEQRVPSAAGSEATSAAGSAALLNRTASHEVPTGDLLGSSPNERMPIQKFMFKS